MDIYSLALMSLLLLLAAAGLMVSHVRSWRVFQRQDLDAEEFDYRRRQFRRRMQTSAMLGILAVVMFAGQTLAEWLESPMSSVILWLVVLLGVCWIALLAVVDIWATQHHYRRLQDKCLIEQAKLQVELRRLQALQGNGKGRALYDGTEDAQRKPR